MSNNLSVQLMAPLSGPLIPIEQVPDPVFSQKMVGEGISIDPVDQCLVAPCNGKIVQLHRAGHALTIQTSNGLEIMIHIGLETVALNGVGFTPKVAVGDWVKCGEELIEFDADFIATTAKSLLTQIVITNSDRLASIESTLSYVTAGQDIILTLSLVEIEKIKSTTESEQIISETISIANPQGLHARPSSVLAAAVKAYQAEVYLYKGDKKANAKSVVSIMSLEVECGDIVTLVADGPDSQQAVGELTTIIKNGLGEKTVDNIEPPISKLELVNKTERRLEKDSAPSGNNPNVITGVMASPGIAVGNVYQWRGNTITAPETAGDYESEKQALKQALTAAEQQLDKLHDALSDQDEAAIFIAHKELLADPDLLERAETVLASGKSAAYAWQHAYTVLAKQLSELKSALLAARANDLEDVGQRVLKIIMGLDDAPQTLPDNTILIAHDLTPSDTANLDPQKVLGFCTVGSGSSSHVAILARAMGIPALAGIETRALALVDGALVILDADEGKLQTNPTNIDIETVVKRQDKLLARRQTDIESADKSAVTRDGFFVEVAANIAGENEAQRAIQLGAEGVGLLRSEFLFINRAAAPTEEEQVECYKQVLNCLGNIRPLIIRTLDVGGDKPLSYLPIAEEENPFLGMRGLRVTLRCEALFRTQLRAILTASCHGNVHIMFPMVTTLDDLRSAKCMLEQERIKLGVDPIPTGMMVEVPTTALMAEQFAKEVDFFSIGTNDLTQYTLAIDRGHPQLAGEADSLNPGVLQLIANTVKSAHKHNKWVGVCGAVAGDPQAVPILLGLGVDELSISVPSIPTVKAQIRELRKEQCMQMAARALQCDTARDVRALVPDSFAEDV